MFDEVSAEAQTEHDGGGVEEQELPLVRSEEVSGDAFDPAIGAEFDGADEGVRDEKDEEDDRAEGELGDDGDDEEECAADGVAGGPASEELGEEIAGDDGSEDSDVLKHFAEAGAFLCGFRFREALSEEHHGIGDGGDEVKGELPFPAEIEFGSEDVACDGADHHAEGPRCVEDVEVVGSVFGEDRCDERIGHGFEGSVRVGEDEHPVFQVVVGVFGSGSEEGNDC